MSPYARDFESRFADYADYICRCCAACDAYAMPIRLRHAAAYVIAVLCRVAVISYGIYVLFMHAAYARHTFTMMADAACRCFMRALMITMPQRMAKRQAP